MKMGYTSKQIQINNCKTPKTKPKKKNAKMQQKPMKEGGQKSNATVRCKQIERMCVQKR